LPLDNLAAVVLATRETGFTAPAELGEQSAPLVEIGGQLLVQRVVDAARGSTRIERVVAVGGEESPEAPFGADEGLPTGDSPDADILAGLTACEGCGQVVLLPGSLPFVRAGDLDAFIAAAEGTGADVVYPMLLRSACEAAFPEFRRSYFRLAEGEVTGGSALCVSRDRLVARPEIIEQAAQIRREPWRLAMMVNPLVLLSFNAGRMSLRDISQAAQKAMGVSAAAILVDTPSLAMDVRRPIDLKAARERLGTA
jgi:GTP:adenosylcobinamide-phosphate guanylyltransferase